LLSILKKTAQFIFEAVLTLTACFFINLPVKRKTANFGSFRTQKWLRMIKVHFVRHKAFYCLSILTFQLKKNYRSTVGKESLRLFECNNRDQYLRLKSSTANKSRPLAKAIEDAERELKNRASINQDLIVIRESMNLQASENEPGSNDSKLVEEESSLNGSGLVADRKPQRSSALNATRKLTLITSKPKTAAQLDRERMKSLTLAERKEHYERTREQYQAWKDLSAKNSSESLSIKSSESVNLIFFSKKSNKNF
jgi:hypothetical protein